jgi:iron complex outermembrane receptor protein
LGDRLSYSASFYAIRQENRLLFTSNPDAESDFTAPPNIATTGQRYHTQGLELTTRMRATRNTTFDVNYGYTNAEWKELVIPTFTGTVDLSGTTPVGVPAHTFMVGMDQRIAERVSTRVWWEHYADYYYTQNNAFKGGAYDLLNLAVTWRPARWRIGQLNLSITNLLDEDYFFLFGTRDRPTYAVPGVPIQARVTVDLRF